MADQRDHASTSYASIGDEGTAGHDHLQQQYRVLLQEIEQGETPARSLSAAVRLIGDALLAIARAEKDLQRQTQQLEATNDSCERERRRYHHLFQFCPVPYLVTDADGIICEANHAAATITRRDAGELAGMHVKELIHEDERQAFGQSMNEMKRAGRIDDWEVRLSPDRDIVTPASISALVCEHREGDAEIRWLVRDLTVAERDRLDLQRMRDEIHRSERLTAIGTLAAGLGHDVKNLLLPMRVRLDSLGAASLPTKAVDDVDGLRHAVSYLQQLANNLQLMAERPDPSQSVQGTTEIEAWWEHVVPLMRTAARSSVQVMADFDDDLPSLNIAPHLLTQAVMNLVNNASEVMPNGGRVKVWAHRSKHGPFVKLGVTDEGPGMSPEVLRHALDPFFTTKPRGHGLSTGMGLSLVRSIVKNVAGSVRIDSSQGRGTSVVLRLPIATDTMLADVDPSASVVYAAVSVSDSHLASTMCTLLNLSRLPSWRCDPHDPGGCRLWIVEPECIPVAMAREYLRTSEKRRLVFFGRQHDQWRDISAVWIDPAASLGTIRDTLSQVAFEVLQGR